MLSATVIIVEVISYKSSLGCPGENFIPYVINYSADGGSCQRDFGERGSLQTGIEISCIPRDLIIVIFYYQISLKSLKTLSLSHVSFPLWIYEL